MECDYIFYPYNLHMKFKGSLNPVIKTFLSWNSDNNIFEPADLFFFILSQIIFFVIAF
jgi:hypothetical protein